MPTSEYDYQFKISVFGSQRTGKSELIQTLISCDHDFSPSYMPNYGPDFYSHKISVNEKNVKLHIWDSAGVKSARNRDMHFYKGTDIFLLCFDYTNKKSLNELVSLLESIEQNKNLESQFILVGTKSDKVHEVTGSDIEQFKQQNGFEDIQLVTTSAQSKKGIDELENIIRDCVINIIEQTKTPEESKTKTQKDYSFFTPTKTKSAATVGLLAGSAAVAMTTLATMGMLALNPIAFGLAVGILATVSAAAISYAGINIGQNYEHNQPIFA